MVVIPNQESKLLPFCDDTPASLGEWLQIYNLFVKKGNNGNIGYNTERITTITASLPKVSARVYDTDGTDFNWTLGGPLNSIFTVTGGSVVVANTVIELGSFSLNVFDADHRYQPTDAWSFTANMTRYAFICCLFEPYENNGSVKVSEPPARVAFVRTFELNFNIMAPIWLARVTRTSGGGIDVANTELLLEHNSVDTKIEQIGYWKNFVVDGGDIV